MIILNYVRTTTYLLNKNRNNNARIRITSNIKWIFEELWMTHKPLPIYTAILVLATYFSFKTKYSCLNYSPF